MMAAANSINEPTIGIVGMTGTGFTATPVTQYLVQIGGATPSTLAEVAIGALGEVLTSNGAGAAPTFQAAGGASYSEGTWSPTFFGSGGDPTISFSGRGGIYRKVGNMVQASASIALNSYSGGGGNLQLGTLPFTSNAGCCGVSAVALGGMTFTSNYVDLYVVQNSTVAMFMTSTTGVNAGFLGVGAGSSTLYLETTIMYES